MKKNNNKKTWKKSHRERTGYKSLINKIKKDPELSKELKEFMEKRGLTEQQAIKRILGMMVITKKLGSN